MSTQVGAARISLVPAAALPPDEPLPWLPESFAALAGRTAGVSPATPSDLIETAEARWPEAALQFIALPSAEPCGFIAVERRVLPEVTIHALAVRPVDRDLGYGVEAVVLIEAAQATGRVYAPVPRTNGLAIYFWLRAGYRPVGLDDDAERCRDPRFLWMLRDLALSGASRGP